MLPIGTPEKPFPGAPNRWENIKVRHVGTDELVDETTRIEILCFYKSEWALRAGTEPIVNYDQESYLICGGWPSSMINWQDFPD